jgi:formylglycine-generating enzyme required for sulfatase activity
VREAGDEAMSRTRGSPGARAAGALLLVGGAGACSQSTPVAPPTGQIVLHIDTDAPVDTGTQTGYGDPLSLFDRMRIDLLPPGATTPCDGCSNDFAVTTAMFQSGVVSVGLAIPPGQDGWTTRARLYPLALALPDGEPNPDTTIDATVGLPSIAATGIVDVSIVLGTDTVGVSQGQGTPLQPAAGLPGPSAVGTWGGAQRFDCTATAPAGMVCVPGGAYWMGSPPSDFTTNTVPGWHRLVVLSPFFLDATEITVAGARGPIQQSMGADEPVPWSGSNTGTSATDWCTYTDSIGPRDKLPLNCIDAPLARSICSLRVPQGDLPTEAQLEYVMGGLQMQPFVWGTELPSCTDAVWGRNGFGILAPAEPQTCLSYSKTLGRMGGPEDPGGGARDRLALPGGTIVDLTGNLWEWARDYYQSQSDACWSPQGVRRDPFCSTPGQGGALQLYRGGSWGVGGVEMEASARQFAAPRNALPEVGFRCMAPGM